MVDFIHLIRKVIESTHFGKLFDANAINICAAPYCKLTVSMFSCNESMYISAVHIKLLADQVFQPCRVKHSTGTDHPLLRETGFFKGYLCQNVYRI